MWRRSWVIRAPAAGVRVLIDRELYVPRSWTGDRDRCEASGIAEDVAFATKPELARKLVGRAVELGLPFAWFAADGAHGGNGTLRRWLADHAISYVVAVACDHRVPAGAGTTIRVTLPAGWRDGEGATVVRSDEAASAPASS